MPTVIHEPIQVEACGTKPKIIKEFFGRVSNQDEAVSVAMMDSPVGWEEPGQTPEFDEYTVVYEGTLRVTTKEDEVDIAAGQAIVARKGEWVKYSTPHEGGAKYVAVCLPAFAPDIVHRDE